MAEKPQKLLFGIELEVIIIPPPQYKPRDYKVSELVEKILIKRKWSDKDTNSIRYRKFTMEQLEQAAPDDLASIRKEDLAHWLKDRYDEYWELAKKDDPSTVHKEAQVSWHDQKKNRDFSKWQITDDISLTTDFKLNKYGIEFVGPIMTLETKNTSLLDIKKELEFFYKFLVDYCKCKVEPDTTCSTHCHVSLGAKDTVTWTFEDVRRLACSAYFWETTFNCILPSNRVKSDFARGFRTKLLADRIPKSDKNAVKNYDSNGQIVLSPEQILANIKELDTIKTREDIEYYLIPDRTCAWNFSNLVIIDIDNIGTVEFRRPQGSKTAADALRWIELTVAFTLAACDTDPQIYEKVKDISVPALYNFIQPYRAADSKTPTSLDELFKRNANTKLGSNAVEEGETPIVVAPFVIPPPPPIPQGPRVTIASTGVDIVQAAAALPGSPREIARAAETIINLYNVQEAKTDPLANLNT